MTSAPGTYALLLDADDEQTIRVGALGDLTVTPGRYVYVGSAFGPGGVQARVRRHVRTGDDKALHWHVDYVRAAMALRGVWYTHDATRRECAWATAFREQDGSRVPMHGLGASDCDCPSHLVRLNAASTPTDLSSALRPLTDAPVHFTSSDGL